MRREVETVIRGRYDAGQGQRRLPAEDAFRRPRNQRRAPLLAGAKLRSKLALS
jgi:hypothetical protein